MTIDAMLLALGRITNQQLVEDSDAKPVPAGTRLNLAILPEMQIKPLERESVISVKNPITGYELQLSGFVDYGVVRYEDWRDNKSMHVS
jgi:hypothetical protein